jgi:hypothetical protein
MRKLPALGSGLFDFDQPASPFPLSSGLFGQGMPTQQQIDAAPAAAAPSFEDKLNGLISNPAFILGMNLLGASRQPNPWGTALQGTLQATSQIAKGKRDQEQMEISRQNAATQQELARLSRERMEAEMPIAQARLAHDQQKMAFEAEEAKRKAAFQQMVQGMIGNGGLFGEGAPPQPTPAMQQGMPPQPMAAPAASPAWGQINAATQAAEPSRLSERLAILNQELQNETDPNNQAALRREINNVMASGMPQQGAPAPIAPQQGGSPDWQRIARTGAMLGMIDPKTGGNLIDYAKLLQPQNTPAGSYRVGPNGAEYLPNPDAQARIAVDQQRLAMDQNREQRAGVEAGRKVNTENAEVHSAYRATDMSLTRMEEAANELAKHKGLGSMAGWSGFVGLNKLPGEGRDATAKMESLKSKLVINTLGELKKLSSTGASGFGQLSEKEGMRLESLIANLEAAQSEPQLREAMANVAAFARETKTMLHETYKSLPGSAGRPLDNSNVRPEADAGKALSLDDYLNKHRPKRSDTAISPREAVGRIR